MYSTKAVAPFALALVFAISLPLIVFAAEENPCLKESATMEGVVTNDCIKCVQKKDEQGTFYFKPVGASCIVRGGGEKTAANCYPNEKLEPGNCAVTYCTPQGVGESPKCFDAPTQKTFDPSKVKDPKDSGELAKQLESASKEPAQTTPLQGSQAGQLNEAFGSEQTGIEPSESEKDTRLKELDEQIRLLQNFKEQNCGAGECRTGVDLGSLNEQLEGLKEEAASLRQETDPTKNLPPGFGLTEGIGLPEKTFGEPSVAAEEDPTCGVACTFQKSEIVQKATDAVDAAMKSLENLNLQNAMQEAIEKFDPSKVDLGSLFKDLVTPGDYQPCAGCLPAQTLSALNELTNTKMAVRYGMPDPSEGGAAAPTQTLRVGSSGADVTKLQQALSDAGFDPGPIDEQFGSKTAAALQAYQQANGLTADGVAGSRTYGQLFPNPTDNWLKAGPGRARLLAETHAETLFQAGQVDRRAFPTPQHLADRVIAGSIIESNYDLGLPSSTDVGNEKTNYGPLQIQAGTLKEAGGDPKNYSLAENIEAAGNLLGEYSKAIGEGKVLRKGQPSLGPDATGEEIRYWAARRYNNSDQYADAIEHVMNGLTGFRASDAPVSYGQVADLLAPVNRSNSSAIQAMVEASQLPVATVASAQPSVLDVTAAIPPRVLEAAAAGRPQFPTAPAAAAVRTAIAVLTGPPPQTASGSVEVASQPVVAQDTTRVGAGVSAGGTGGVRFEPPPSLPDPNPTRVASQQPAPSTVVAPSPQVPLPSSSSPLPIAVPQVSKLISPYQAWGGNLPSIAERRELYNYLASEGYAPPVTRYRGTFQENVNLIAALIKWQQTHR